jgi:GNAT superfamily N-acetyltransferase
MALAAVRPAVRTDVDEIVRIQAATWAAAYAELVPPAALAQLDSAGARQAWTAAIEAGAGHHVLIATEGAWTVGFCAAAAGEARAAGEAPVPGEQPRNGRAQPGADVGPEFWGEIGTLLVEPRWGRRGHAGRLLAAAATALQAAGARYGLAWIPETDEASRRFYTRAGWEPDGAVRGLDTGGGILREVRVTGSLDLTLHG